jgi:hypothetical protein
MRAEAWFIVLVAALRALFGVVPLLRFERGFVLAAITRLL